MVEIFDNKIRKVVAKRPWDEVTAVTITGASDEADMLTVDYSGGLFWPPDGITFTAGTGGGNTLRVRAANTNVLT
jgi:hypothetical protein